ncbi:hypothetical protein PENANT_c001G11762 [Penicillium antarcticum]|uniref:Uncharacterized protein n=1 Tax=Penicillium antarcticum TaxID=416450 RepID=A0A1V6QNK0_9EURO|nr:hypothetical protein PENANT_c001G11762 [Penicillium antarcticum]
MAMKGAPGTSLLHPDSEGKWHLTTDELAELCQAFQTNTKNSSGRWTIACAIIVLILALPRAIWACLQMRTLLEGRDPEARVARLEGTVETTQKSLDNLTPAVGQAVGSGEVAANALTAVIASGSEVAKSSQGLTRSGQRCGINIPAKDDK